MTKLEAIKQQVNELSEIERAELWDYLAINPQLESDEIAAEWEVECERRFAEMEAGTVAVYSAEEVLAEVKRTIERVRSERL